MKSIFVTTVINVSTCSTGGKITSEEVFPATIPKVHFNNFEISCSEPDQKLSQLTIETVPHVTIEIIENF